MRTKCVEKQVVPVIFPEDLDLTRLLTKRVTIQKKDKLDACSKSGVGTFNEMNMAHQAQWLPPEWKGGEIVSGSHFC
jgi:hypothetical protein